MYCVCVCVYVCVGGGHSAPNHPVMPHRKVYRWDCTGQFYGGNSGAQPCPQVSLLVRKVAGPFGRYNNNIMFNNK